MAEFAIAVAVLISLLLGMPVISRYHELKLATIEGARQLAFQSAWRQPGAVAPAAESIRAALFPPVASPDQPDAERVEVRFAADPAPGPAGQAEYSLLAPFQLTGRATAGFDLRDHTLHRAELSVTVSRPAELPQPFGELPVAFSSTYVLLGDDWASSGPEQVAGRAGGLLLTHSLRSLRSLTRLGTGLLSLIEPAFREFCPGLVNPELVPADRLATRGVGDSSPPTLWRARC
jgi:hypothetical protein